MKASFCGPFFKYYLGEIHVTIYNTLLIKWGECFKNNKKERKHIEALCQSFESYRIRSFSRLKDKQKRDTVKNVLMWSHYADGHKGFCIKYKFSKKFIKTEDRFVSRFKEVIYHDRNKPFDLHVNLMSTDQALCTKLNDWEYENEVRLITYAPDVDKQYLKLPIDNKSFIEAIYFGYCCTDETRKTIKNALSYNPEIKYIMMNSNYSDIYQLQEKPHF